MEKQLATVVVDVETVVNTNPLIYVDDDINSSTVITPSHFLSLYSQNIILDMVEDSKSDQNYEAKADYCTAVIGNLEARTEAVKSVLESMVE